MKTKKIVTIFLTLMITLSLAPFISTVSAVPITIYVDDSNTSAPWDGTQSNPYQTIQDGIDAANDYDTVYVYAGTYTENIDVNSFTSLKILAENGGQSVVVNPALLYDEVFVVKSDGVTIDGFEIQCYGNGIDCNGSYNQFKNNIIYNLTGSFANIGILINGDNSIGNKIIGNELYNFAMPAIMIEDADSTIISKNVIYQSIEGISLYNFDISKNCNNNIVTKNEIYKVSSGISLSAGKGLLNNNIISFNNIHTPDTLIWGNGAGIGFDIYPQGTIKKTKVIHNKISGHGYGVYNYGDYGIIHHNDAVNIILQDYVDYGTGNKDFKNSWN
jgi:hypothetical protein